MENLKISEIVRTTANNMYELLQQMAAHIDRLELENAELKEKLQNESK